MSPVATWTTLVVRGLQTLAHEGIQLVRLLLARLSLESPYLVLSSLRGMSDTLLFFLFGLTLLSSSRLYMDGRYTLSRPVQTTVLKWAPVADRIARKSDIPREVPLVLWYKENSMQAVNPENCTGIIGAYDLVRSGERECFTPGPLSDAEVTEQLAVAAVEFKKRCPEIDYWTQDPEVIKRCYLAYNAGSGGARYLDPNQSAYVMNGYDAAHTDMVYSDVELGTVTVKALGAWPTHLAIQSIVVSRWDHAERPYTLALLDAGTRFFDWARLSLQELELSLDGQATMAFPARRQPGDDDCLSPPHLLGRSSLRPRRNPVSEAPILTQDVHGCSYGLPGLDISSSNSHALLQAPMDGELTTYTDRWHNTTIRIENREWIVWLLHPRSYLLEEGKVRRGEAVGVMGAVGYATGPHVHYSVYDKVNKSFVDPGLFLQTEPASK